MKETLKRIKADIIVSALLCIALGIAGSDDRCIL